MENQIIYQFHRNENEQVCFSFREYKDRKYIDLRVFFKPLDAQEIRPTKKGITLALQYLPELKKGIAVCEKKLLNEATEK